MNTGKELLENNKDKNSKSIILLGLLPFFSLLIIATIGFINKSNYIDIIKLGILTFLLTTIIVFFIRMQLDILETRYARLIIMFSYLVSILLIMIPSNPDVYSFWMIGGLFTAMIVDSKLGLLIYFNMTFILGLTYTLGPGDIIHFLVMGVLFALLAKYLKDKTTVISASIILLSTDITLSFLLNNFIFETDRSFNYMASLFSVFAVLVTAFFLSYLYEKISVKSLEKESQLREAIDENITNTEEENIFTTNALTDNDKILNTRTSYEILLSEDNELRMKMKDYSESLYNHCNLIGDLSGRAAREIGANEELSRAGGYYHEVGKINGKNYIEEGLKIADQYKFPEKLKEILRQHNIKYDKPTFIESAIVMISDNVVSTIDYIEKSGKQKFASDKIIDNIFKMRLDKGTFDDAVLSLKDYKLLKEFYKKEFAKKNDRSDEDYEVVKNNEVIKEESV